MLLTPTVLLLVEPELFNLLLENGQAQMLILLIKRKKTNCMVCIDDSSCDSLTTTADIELDTNAYAIGKDTVNWEFN